VTPRRTAHRIAVFGAVKGCSRICCRSTAVLWTARNLLADAEKSFVALMMKGWLDEDTPQP
jgi:hypothetical protein